MSDSTELQGISRITLHEGKLEEFKRLGARFVEITRTTDTGTLQFEIYANEDESEWIVLERYRDSDALMEHAAHVGELAAAIPAMGSVSAVCLGEPSPTLRAMLTAGEVTLFAPYASV